MTSSTSGLPVDPLEVNFRYGLRHKTNGRQYRLGSGWLPSTGDMYENQLSLFSLYEAHLGAKAFRELLEVSQIVKYRISTSFEREHVVPSKLKGELDRKLEAENIFASDAPEYIRGEYFNYHTRGGPAKSTYHYAFQFPRKTTQKWLNSKKDKFKLEHFGYTWVSADIFEIQGVIKGIAKMHGLKYPQVRAHFDTLLFRTKTDAMVFRLALEMPATFFDFEAIHANFKATNKIDIAAS